MFSAFRLSESSSIVTLRVYKEEVADEDVQTNGFHLVLLIDTSLIMQGERIQTVQRTINVLIDHMTLSDRLSIIEWNNTATILCKQTSDKEELKRAVDSIEVRGGTCMEAGISSLGSFTPEERASIDGVFLLTDGEINQGLQNPTGLRFLVRLLLPSSVPIFTVGYGADHNAKLLQSLAVYSHGSYTFASSAEVIPATIGDIVGGFRSEIAREGVMNLPEGGTCLEWGSEEEGRCVSTGSWISGRSHWYVLDLPVSTDHIDLKWKQNGSVHEMAVPITIAASDNEKSDAYTQWFRVRFVKLIQSLDTVRCEEAIQRLQEFDREMSESVAATAPLVLSLRAQLQDKIQQKQQQQQQQPFSFPFHGLHREDMFRGVSDMTTLATQRGIMLNGDPAMFASPLQRMVSAAMVVSCTQEADPS